MKRGFLKFAAALLGTVMVVVPFAGFDSLPREIRAQVAAERSALSSAQANARAARDEVSRDLETERDLFHAIPASRQWPDQLNSASRDLDAAAADMSQLTALEKQNRRQDRARVEALLAHERGLRAVAAARAAAVQKDAAHWVDLKRRLPGELDQMDRDYKAIHTFDFAGVSAAVQKAETDFPEKRADLDSRLSALRGGVGQSDALWQSSAAARKQAAEQRFADLDFAGLFAATESVHAIAAGLPAKSTELQSQTGQLYTSWDKVLVDMRRKGNNQFDQQIRTVTARQGGETTSDEKWVTVSRGTFEAMQNNLGMAIEHKAAGKYDSEAERTAQPAGFAYMAPPGQRNQYGYWENRNGHDTWVFLAQYLVMRDLLFNRDYRPLDRGDWEGYRTSQQRGQTYYGQDPATAAPKYGTQGTATQDRYSGSTFSKSGGFKDSQYASKPGGYRDSKYASPNARQPDADHSPRTFGSGGGSKPDQPHAAPPPRPNYRPSTPSRPPSAPRRFGKR